jgi:hypothetical protein
MNTAVTANTDPLIELRDFTFRFKKDGLGNKRQNVELRVPVPSAEGLAAILTDGGKPLELLIDIAADFVRTQVASYVGDTEEVNQENFPTDKFGFAYLANLPKEDRRSAAIAKEVWEEFAKDYILVMPARTGKSVDAVTNAADLFIKKLTPAKTNKKVINKLKEQISIYAETENAERFEEVLSFLVRRADAYLAADDVVITDDMI